MHETNVMPKSFLRRTSPSTLPATPSAQVSSLVLPACYPGDKEAKLLSGSCDAGDAAACNKFGAKLQKGDFVLQDKGRAATVFDRACKGHVGEACARLGSMLQQGDGVSRDSARALKLFEQACAQGQWTVARDRA